MLNVTAFGEFMLRLSPPGNERFFQSPHLSATFGGAEANVLVSLAAFGHRTRYLSLIPAGPLGDAAVTELRKRGVATEFIARKGNKLGIYFAETGAAQRPSRVIYDRERSALAEALPGDIDWKRALAGADWLHVTGITPALSASAAEMNLEALRSARDEKVKVSLDLNYRAKLWRYGKSAPEVMAGLAAQADIMMANEEDCQKSLGLDAGFDPEKISDLVLSRFPQLEAIAITLRQSYDADHNGWSAVLRSRTGFWTGPKFNIPRIVDRIGAGDAFAAGFIHGWNTLAGPQEALDFAVAASCLKHSIPGDFNLVTEAEVMDLLRGDSSGRVRR